MVGQTLFDKEVGFAADLNRLEPSLRAKARAHLQRLAKDIRAALLENDVTTKEGKARAAMLKKLMAQVDSSIATTYKIIRDENIADVRRVAELSANVARDNFNAAIGFELATTTLSPSRIASIARGALIEGAKSAEWWSVQAGTTRQRFEREVAQGVALGETIDEITKRVDGVMQTRGRDAEMLVRTSVINAANAAREETYQANSDVISGIEWLATLDSRTTSICRGLDGLRWTLNYEPIGHGQKYPGRTAHWGCRSTQVPVVKMFDELPKEKQKAFAEKVSRPTKNIDDTRGEAVSQSTTYSDWLRKQPREMRLEILGPTRERLFMVNKLTMTDMLDASNNPLTLDELFDRYGIGSIGAARTVDDAFAGAKFDMGKAVFVKPSDAPVLGELRATISGDDELLEKFDTLREANAKFVYTENQYGEWKIKGVEVYARLGVEDAREMYRTGLLRPAYTDRDGNALFFSLDKKATTYANFAGDSKGTLVKFVVPLDKIKLTGRSTKFDVEIVMPVANSSFVDVSKTLVRPTKTDDLTSSAGRFRTLAFDDSGVAVVRNVEDLADLSAFDLTDEDVDLQLKADFFEIQNPTLPAWRRDDVRETLDEWMTEYADMRKPMENARLDTMGGPLREQVQDLQETIWDALDDASRAKVEKALEAFRADPLKNINAYAKTLQSATLDRAALEGAKDANFEKALAAFKADPKKNADAFTTALQSASLDDAYGTGSKVNAQAVVRHYATGWAGDNYRQLLLDAQSIEPKWPRSTGTAPAIVEINSPQYRFSRVYAKILVPDDVGFDPKKYYLAYPMTAGGITPPQGYSYVNALVPASAIVGPGRREFGELIVRMNAPSGQSIHLLPSRGIVPTVDDMMAIEKYTSYGHKQVNGYLRGASETFSGEPITPEAPFYARALDKALTRMPVFRGEVTRVIRPMSIDSFEAAVSFYAPGSVVTETGFTSASTNIDFEWGEEVKRNGGGLILHLRSKTGRQIASYSTLASEEEVLFPRGVQFNVKRAAKRKPLNINGMPYFEIWAEEL